MAAPALSSAFEYLERLAVNHRKRLYQQPSTALAIFRRMLPHLAKTLVMAMLYRLHPVPVKDVDAWVKPESKREKDQAISLLERMDMLSVIQEKDRSRSYMLAKPFVTSLRQALTGGGDHRSFGVPYDGPEEGRKTISQLDDFARRQWDSILYFVVGSVEAGGDMNSTIAPGSRELLKVGKFVNFNGRHASITQEGFEFLLRDINTQVWSLLIVYLNQGQLQGMDSIEILSFLFTLGSLEVGQDYSIANLTASQLTTLDDLHDLGIVYRSPSHSPRFYPTRLATTLNSDSNAISSCLSGGLSLGGATAADERGFIVVETNYRIYAYTTNPLRMAILSLFTKMTTQYPNMIAGKLTKKSVQDAIGRGITSQQIIAYLTTHAHPVMATHGRHTNPGAASNNQQLQPSLPPTVVDQIRLWQIEGDRMTPTSGYLFQEFVDERQYKACLEHAETVGVLQWHDDKRRVFFVTKYDQVKSFLSNWSKDAPRTNGAG